MTIKYGLFEYTTENIGDEIQSIAARRFLPRVDYYFDRDNIDLTDTHGDTVKLIMNGWYTHKPENFPPLNKDIKPLLISMYVEQHINDGATAKRFKSKKSKAFFKKNGPVGARDLSTLQYFKDNGIKSYFSGCVTLTLERDERIKDKEYVLAVDVSDAVYDMVRSMTDREVIRIDTNHCSDMSRDSRFAMAEYFLTLYQSASSVITTRLHCMLPCLALKTPVFAIAGREPHRYAGLIDLARHSTEEEFLANAKNLFSFDNPSPNSDDYMKIRNKLIKKCSAYTGYDSSGSYFTYESLDSLLESNEFTNAVSSVFQASFKMENLNRHINYLNEQLGKLETEAREKREKAAYLESYIFDYGSMGVAMSAKHLYFSGVRYLKKKASKIKSKIKR